MLLEALTIAPDRPVFFRSGDGREKGIHGVQLLWKVDLQLEACPPTLQVRVRRAIAAVLVIGRSSSAAAGSNPASTCWARSGCQSRSSFFHRSFRYFLVGVLLWGYQFEGGVQQLWAVQA